MIFCFRNDTNRENSKVSEDNGTHFANFGNSGEFIFYFCKRSEK